MEYNIVDILSFFHRPWRAANLGGNDVCVDLDICHAGEAGQRGTHRSYRRAITIFLALQTAMVLCLYGAWHPWQYYVIGALFGVGMGGPMPMYALLFREFFGQNASARSLACSPLCIQRGWP